MDKEQEQLDTADSEYFFKAQKEQSLWKALALNWLILEFTYLFQIL